MRRIDTERRKPDPENPNRLIYDGQRTAQEIFSELRYRLESTGYLPDEYFMLNMDWENGREWPEDGDIFCTVDYGGSEGIYLDIYMKYRDKEGNPQTKGFATGKTLGEADEDMDRMFLIASAVTKAFHSDGVHARYVRVGEREPEPQSGAVIHLNPEERKIITESLIDTRLRWKQENKPLEKIEQLLRRIIGSITEFVKAVGERPQTVDDYDRAVLAVADGDMNEFTSALPRVPHVYGNLLEKAAARPDMTGRAMTELLCASATEIDNGMYLRACKNAVDTNDVDRVIHMLSSAEKCVPDLNPGFYGDVILHALSCDEKHGGRKTNAAAAIAAHCAPEQIQGADPFLLKLAIMYDDRQLVNTLLDRGISVRHEPAMLLYAAAQKKDVYLADRLIKAGADVNGQKHAALFACMNTSDLPSAMFLLKCGADFEAFSNEVIEHGVGGRKLSDNEAGFFYALKGFWENNIKEPEAEAGQDGEDYEQGDD